MVQALYTDGIAARKGAFSRDWAAQMREDIETAFAEARSRENGAVGRGPNRYYVEIHPEQLRGFVDLVDHPWVRAVGEAVLGPEYQIVEVGFDIPFAGAMNQPWHRDFPMPEETRQEGRLTSLAFNLTAVDTTEEMGPFEIAPGTQWDWSEEFDHGMFPPKSAVPALRGAGRAQVPADGRHLGPLRADHPPRHPEPLRAVAARAGAGPRRARGRATPSTTTWPSPTATTRPCPSGCAAPGCPVVDG